MRSGRGAGLHLGDGELAGPSGGPSGPHALLAVSHECGRHLWAGMHIELLDDVRLGRSVFGDQTNPVAFGDDTAFDSEHRVGLFELVVLVGEDRPSRMYVERHVERRRLGLIDAMKCELPASQGHDRYGAFDASHDRALPDACFRAFGDRSTTVLHEFYSLCSRAIQGELLRCTYFNINNGNYILDVTIYP